MREVAWFSVYEVGQRLTYKFDYVPACAEHLRTPRVFIAVDAGHTHSAKAVQWMNVSMQYTFNFALKFAAVLERRSEPNLLHTYSAERQAVAKDLIDFDREWSATIAQRPLYAGIPSRVVSIRQICSRHSPVRPVHRRLATQYTRSPRPAREHQALAKVFRWHALPLCTGGADSLREAAAVRHVH